MTFGKPSTVFLLAFLHYIVVYGASVNPHRQWGGNQEEFNPSSDMIKALEYIESLKQRTDDSESPTGDYDKVDKFRLLVQLASLRDEDSPGRGDATGWPDDKATEWVQSLLRMLDESPESVPNPENERHSHKNRRPETGPGGPAVNMVRPHKKYPLMFEDEENVHSNKRATEDLDEQYTPQSLANMRSIFEELGKLNQKREEDEEDEEYKTRSPAYEDVVGGEDWMPLEEQVETEEMVKNSQEFERELEDSNEEQDIERRAADPRTADPDDDTKFEDYVLLKVMEMTDQAQKRDLMDAQNGRRKLLNRPSLIDPRAIKQLLSAVSMKLQIPPEDLVGMLFMEETRKQQRLPDVQSVRKPNPPRYRSRLIKYYNGRQPEVTLSNIPADVKTEDILKVLGLGNLANRNNNYYLKPSPYKTSLGKYFLPGPRRGSYSMSELSRAPSKRKDDFDDAEGEDEVATFLAAKLLTEYPDTGSPDHKRAADFTFPYEVYEEAMKDYFDQVDTGKSAPTKRDTQGKLEAEAQQKKNTEVTIADQQSDQRMEPVTEGEKEHHTKLVAGM